MQRFGVLFLAKEPVLTHSQLDKLADVFIAVGQLAMASMVLPFTVPSLDVEKTFVIFLGVAGAVSCWLISILLVRRLE